MQPWETTGNGKKRKEHNRTIMKPVMERCTVREYFEKVINAIKRKTWHRTIKS